MESWRRFTDNVERLLLEYYMREACIAISTLIYESFGDTLEYKVLRALSAGPLTLKGLARALGERESSVKAFPGYVGRLRRTVERLEAKGLIQAKRSGRAKFYSIAGGARGRLLRELLRVPPTEAGLDHGPSLP